MPLFILSPPVTSPDRIQSPHHSLQGPRDLSPGHSWSRLLPLLLTEPGQSSLHVIPWVCQGLGTCWSLPGMLFPSIFNHVSKQISFPPRGFSWLSLRERHPVSSSYTSIFCLLCFSSQCLSTTDWALHNYVFVYLFSPNSVPWQHRLHLFCYFSTLQHLEQCPTLEIFILFF